MYSHEVVRDPDTGQSKRTWSYLETVECQARGPMGTGLEPGSSMDSFRNRLFVEQNFVRINTAKPISTRYRVANIRPIESHEATWKDWESDEPLRFDVIGCQPVPAPLGPTDEYQITLEHVQDGLEEQWA